MLRLTTLPLAVLLALGLHDAARAQDEIISTWPPVIQESAVPLAPVAQPAAPAPQVDPAVDAYMERWLATPAEPSYSRGQRIFVNDTPAAPEPLPDWALEEPVRYVAEMCRPGIRPSSEEVEACFTRVEHEVNQARANESAPRGQATRRECREEIVRSADGREVSTSYSCTVGNGDLPLLNALMDRD